MAHWDSGSPSPSHKFKSRMAENQNRFRQKRRSMVNAIKEERGCMDCGTHHPAVLDFHHKEGLNGNIKNRVSRMVSENASWQRILEQIEKCDVLCANCHRIRHYNERV